jgi:Ca-activated chloride channel homolog
MMRKNLAIAILLCALPGWLKAQEPKPSPPASGAQTTSTPSSSATTASTSNSTSTSNQPAVTTSTIKVPVYYVDVPLTVIDKKGRLVIMMTKDDFSLFEDGKAQDITYFSRETDLAMRIGLLIDTSNSIRDRFHFEQQAAIDFLTDTIRRGKDQAFVLSFDAAPLITQEYTDDVQKLSAAIDNLQPGGVTSLYDAIFLACREKLYFFPPPEPYLRKVMILISDGEDNHSEHTREEALAMAQKAGVTIFAISTNRSGAEERGDKVLKRLAQETGGRAFFPFEASDLAEDFRAIGRDLRTQFLIDYVSTNTARDGTYRAISVVPNDKTLTVRAKTGYFAPNQ